MSRDVHHVETEANQSFATLKQPFGDTAFKLFIKKQKTQKEHLTLPPFPAQVIQREKPASGRRSEDARLSLI